MALTRASVWMLISWICCVCLGERPLAQVSANIIVCELVCGQLIGVTYPLSSLSGPWILFVGWVLSFKLCV